MKRTPKRTIPVDRRGVGLARISKDRAEETSTTTQEQRIRAHGEAQEIEILGVVVEVGSAYSASWRSRPGMAKALRMIDAGAANTFIVWRVDRACRNLKDLLALVDYLEHRGAALVSVTEGFDTSTPTGRLIMQILGALAEMESAIKSERIESWHGSRWDTARHTNGVLPPTGPRPFGYRREPNELHIRDDEADVIRRCADGLLAGEKLTAICRDLSETGATKNGEPLDRRSILQVLQRPTVAGLRLVDGDYVKGCWEPILEPEMWHQIVAILRDPSRRTTPGPGRRWLLTGLIRCGRDGCGDAMRSASHDQGTRYRCDACGLSIDAARTDEAVSGALLEVLGGDSWKRLRRRGRGRANTTAVQDELGELQEMFDRDDIDFETWKDMVASIRRKAKAAAAAPVELPSVDDLRAAWPGLDVGAKRLVITATLEDGAITVKPAVRGRNKFDVGRIDVDLTVP